MEFIQQLAQYLSEHINELYASILLLPTADFFNNVLLKLRSVEGRSKLRFIGASFITLLITTALNFNDLQAGNALEFTESFGLVFVVSQFLFKLLYDDTVLRDLFVRFLDVLRNLDKLRIQKPVVEPPAVIVPPTEVPPVEPTPEVPAQPVG